MSGRGSYSPSGYSISKVEALRDFAGVSAGSRQGDLKVKSIPQRKQRSYFGRQEGENQTKNIFHFGGGLGNPRKEGCILCN
jgi:hypothetical protein